VQSERVDFPFRRSVQDLVPFKTSLLLSPEGMLQFWAGRAIFQTFDVTQDSPKVFFFVLS
jgi:hypothetical protein